MTTGGEDKTIRLHYLSRVVRTFNDVPLPTMFQVIVAHSNFKDTIGKTGCNKQWFRFLLKPH